AALAAKTIQIALNDRVRPFWRSFSCERRMTRSDPARTFPQSNRNVSKGWEADVALLKKPVGKHRLREGFSAAVTAAIGPQIRKTAVFRCDTNNAALFAYLILLPGGVRHYN
ncbi:hypothetical protein, partial [Mesorhizobium sp. M0060]|uniref:hypothetical protein n=1 Tax=Mesorhizobium sp. M0060 TaxID=2956866 RepID=UPI00333618DF